jgi:plasmid stabilization system protein ParE
VTLRIVIESPAKADLAVAVRWYKQIQPGLETDFRLCVRAALHRIARHPESYPVVGRRLRRALIERFPFAIFYVEDSDAIRVFGVLHTRRSPRVWQARNH